MNMELKQQVCRLELSKRLDELGVKQNGYFQWQPWVDNEGKQHYQVLSTYMIIINNKRLSAFTLAELGEILPDYLPHPDEDDQILHLICEKQEMWSIHYSYDGYYKTFKDENEANARAKMLIYLIENGLVKL